MSILAPVGLFFVSAFLFFFLLFALGDGSFAATLAIVNASFSGELKGEGWDGPNGAMAKILLLDQFPRAAYR